MYLTEEKGPNTVGHWLFNCFGFRTQILHWTLSVFFYLRHLKGHLLVIVFEDISKQTQCSFSWSQILLLHFHPGCLSLTPVIGFL